MYINVFEEYLQIKSGISLLLVRLSYGVNVFIRLAMLLLLVLLILESMVKLWSYIAIVTSSESFVSNKLGC